MIGGFAFAAVLLIRLGIDRELGGSPNDPPPQATAGVRTAEAPIIFSGVGNQTSDTFYLAGGTYRGHWAAWGPAAEYPPCTHSAALLAVDAETSHVQVTDLAHLVDVPATGASDESYVYNVKPGDYYLDVNSACAWQIALSPNDL